MARTMTWEEEVMKSKIKVKAKNKLKDKNNIRDLNKMQAKRIINLKKTSVKKKIIFTALSIIIILSLLQVFTIKLGYSIDSKYSEVVTQIGMSGQVVNTMKKLDPAISDHILRKDNGADLTQNEDLKEAERIVEELIRTSTNKEELLVIDGVKRLLETYRKTINNISEAMKNSDMTTAIEQKDYAKELEGFISENMQQYIFLQLDTASQLKEDIQGQFRFSVIMTMFITVTVVSGSIISILKIVQDISKPLSQVCNSADKVAKGDLTVESLHVRTKDEIRDLANSFNTMIENVRNSIKDVKDMSAKVHIAAKNLSTITKENSKVSEQISNSVNNMAEGIHVQSEQANTITEHIQNIYMITSQVDQNDKKVLASSNKSVELANTGVIYSKQFMDKMQQINEKIRISSETTETLNQRAKEVYNILSALGNIASETHLLSLNASIEAARAGEEGRGFAVVAEEIRKLAVSSSDFSEELRSIIELFEDSLSEINNQMLENVKYIEEGSQLAVKTQEFFDTIKDANYVVNKDIEENVKELEELTLKIKGVSEAMDKNNEVIQGNEETSCSISAAIEEQLASIEELEAEAMQLHELAANMDKSISVFNI